MLGEVGTLIHRKITKNFASKQREDVKSGHGHEKNHPGNPFAEVTFWVNLS